MSIGAKKKKKGFWRPGLPKTQTIIEMIQAAILRPGKSVIKQNRNFNDKARPEAFELKKSLPRVVWEGEHVRGHAYGVVEKSFRTLLADGAVHACSMCVNVGDCSKIKCTWRPQKDSWCHKVHRGRTPSPKPFSQRCNADEAGNQQLASQGNIVLLLPVSHWRQNIKQEKAKS